MRARTQERRPRRQATKPQEWKPHRDGYGDLRKNDKGGNASRPDFRGEATIGGIRYRVSGWKKRTGAGDPKLSLSFEPIEDERVKTAEAEAAEFDDEGLDDLDETLWADE